MAAMNQMCGSCCDSSCRPRLSIGVVYPNGAIELANSAAIDFNSLCGSGCGCSDCCRPRLSIGVVYPNELTQLAGFDKTLGLTSLGSCGCAPCCTPSCGDCCGGCGGNCRPRLSVGVVYDGAQNLQ